MTTPSSPSGQKVSQQYVLMAMAEGALMIGVVLFFIIGPQTTLLVVLAAIAFAIGLVLAVMTIYRAVPLMSEPSTRFIGYLSVVLVVTGPIVLYAVSQFLL